MDVWNGELDCSIPDTRLGNRIYYILLKVILA